MRMRYIIFFTFDTDIALPSSNHSEGQENENQLLSWVTVTWHGRRGH